MLTVFLFGIVIALLIEEWTGISPGGIVSAAFIALMLDTPVILLLTAIATAGAFGAVLAAERVMLLHGRRRFAFAVIAGATIKSLLLLVYTDISIDQSPMLLLGFVIPGVVADSCIKQGATKALSALLFAVTVLGLLRFGVAS